MGKKVYIKYTKYISEDDTKIHLKVIPRKHAKGLISKQ